MATVFTSRLLSCPTGENKSSPRIDLNCLQSPLFQLHMQHKDNLERGRDGGCEGSPSNQEGHRDHQELCQQVPSLYFPSLSFPSLYFHPLSTSFLTTQKRQELLQDGWYFRWVGGFWLVNNVFPPQMQVPSLPGPT